MMCTIVGVSTTSAFSCGYGKGGRVAQDQGVRHRHNSPASGTH